MEPERHDLMLTAPAFGHELQVLTGTDGVLGPERRPREGREKSVTVVDTVGCPLCPLSYTDRLWLTPPAIVLPISSPGR